MNNNDLIDKSSLRPKYIKEIFIGYIQDKRWFTNECMVSTDHIKGNKVGKVFICNTDITRYFKTETLSESEDILYEIGYYPRLLKSRTLEEAEELLLNKELIDCTDEQTKQAKEENSWC